ncbi:MAG: WXG100 family type VII secretion target, partial [Catenulispora sp.]|nr:WXG100 family type VII secretion target [Catenulispora sp.]
MGDYYNRYTGASDPLAWRHDGRCDKGFFNYQRLLRSGTPHDLESAITGWDLCADSLRTVANDLYNAYQRISRTWAGDAANAFYEELAKVQNYAVSLLLQIDSSLGKGVNLIPAATATAGAGTATGTGGYVTPQQVYSGYATMASLTAGGSSPAPTSTGDATAGSGTQITADMVGILKDCAQMITHAGVLAGNTLPDPDRDLQSAAVSTFRLACWMCGQAVHENWQDALLFFSELAGVAVAAALAPEVVATTEAVVAIVETLNTPITEPVRNLVLGTMTAKVMLDTLGWHSITSDAGNSPPMTNMNALGQAWVMNAKSLPGKLDPGRITHGGPGSGTTQPTYPGPGSASLPTGPSGPTSGPHLDTPKVTAPKTTTPTSPGHLTGPTDPLFPKNGTDPFTGTGTDTGLKPFDPHSGSLASYNPHSGLGTGSHLGGGTGLGG